MNFQNVPHGRCQTFDYGTLAHQFHLPLPIELFQSEARDLVRHGTHVSERVRIAMSAYHP